MEDYEKVACIRIRRGKDCYRAPAPTVYPDWDSILMLEIVNPGVTKVALHFGMAIAQLIIEQVFGDVIRNPSQFQTQSTPEGL